MMSEIIYFEVPVFDFHCRPIAKYPQGKEYPCLFCIKQFGRMQREVFGKINPEGIIPTGPLTVGPNGRDPITDTESAKAKKKAMEMTYISEKKSFQCSNVGIFIHATSVEYIEETNSVRIGFNQQNLDGILNGGTTNYNIALFAGYLNLPDDWDVVPVTFRVGCEHDAVIEQSVHLNESIGVTKQTQGNTAGDYEIVKQILIRDGYDKDSMSYYMHHRVDGEKLFHSSDDLILTLMHLMSKPLVPAHRMKDEDAHCPTGVISNKAESFRFFEKNKDEVMSKFDPILTQVYYLFDHIQGTFLDMVPTVSAHCFVTPNGAPHEKDEKYDVNTYISPFTHKRVFKLKTPIIMSAMWTMRYLLEEKNGVMQWVIPFDDVLEFWNQNGRDLIADVWHDRFCERDGSIKKGVDAQNIIRDKNFWKIVAANMSGFINDMKQANADAVQSSLETNVNRV